jgi:hypothetical protein
MHALPGLILELHFSAKLFLEARTKATLTIVAADQIKLLSAKLFKNM